LPALWTADASLVDRLHFGGFAQTGTTKEREMGDKHDSRRAHSQGRTLAAEVKTLEANSNFPESENKTIQERDE
jgi:hypothetical protein